MASLEIGSAPLHTKILPRFWQKLIPTADCSYFLVQYSVPDHILQAVFIQPKLLPKGLRDITWSVAISGLIQPGFCLSDVQEKIMRQGWSLQVNETPQLEGRNLREGAWEAEKEEGMWGYLYSVERIARAGLFSSIIKTIWFVRA